MKQKIIKCRIKSSAESVTVDIYRQLVETVEKTKMQRCKRQLPQPPKSQMICPDMKNGQYQATLDSIQVKILEEL